MSPFSSFAQMRKFGSLVAQKKISKETFNEWRSKTNTSNLPERVKKVVKKKKK